MALDDAPAMTGTMTPTRAALLPRWALALLAAVLAVAVGLFTAGSASAATASAAETRVGASHSTVGTVVGLSANITAGQRLGNDLPQPGSVVATGVAASTASRSPIDDVISETLGASKKNITSKYTLSADDVLTTAERWLGEGYREIGKPGSGVFRSAGGTRQFRMDMNSILGNHSPNVPHVHFEIYAPGARVPSVNNHVPFME